MANKDSFNHSFNHYLRTVVFYRTNTFTVYNIAGLRNSMCSTILYALNSMSQFTLHVVCLQHLAALMFDVLFIRDEQLLR